MVDKRIKWTAEQDAYIRKNYTKKSNEEMAKELHKIADNVWWRKKILGLKGGFTYKGKYQRTAAHKKIMSIAKSREKNGQWNGGRYQDHNGYIHIKERNHPYMTNDGYVLEHRLVMEKHIGRYLEPTEVVHHINEESDDNRIENLKLFKNQNVHVAYHNRKKKNG